MNARRAFVRAVSLALVAPLIALAQTRAKLHRVGVLHGRFPGDANVEAFRQGMRELGYREGENAHFEIRWAEGRPERLAGLASELVAQKVDIIFTATTTGALAAKKATSTIPIVFAAVGDPVEAGVVANLSHPLGNITGLSHNSIDLGGKVLELLKETLPRITRVAVIAPTTNPATMLKLRNVEKGAKALSLKLLVTEVRSPDDFGPAFSQIRKNKPDALYVLLDTITLSRSRDIAEFASQSRLPSIYEQQEFVDAGGLMSYATSFPAMYRRAATYVDKILKGAKPGELPVELPTTFELIINMKTAKALGVSIPQPVLFRADKVIE
jgi:putative ABC transport system substrate-binding protein